MYDPSGSWSLSDSPLQGSGPNYISEVAKGHKRGETEMAITKAGQSVQKWAPKDLREEVELIEKEAWNAALTRLHARYNALPQGQYRLMAIYDLLKEEVIG